MVRGENLEIEKGEVSSKKRLMSVGELFAKGFDLAEEKFPLLWKIYLPIIVLSIVFISLASITMEYDFINSVNILENSQKANPRYDINISKILSIQRGHFLEQKTLNELKEEAKLTFGGFVVDKIEKNTSSMGMSFFIVLIRAVTVIMQLLLGILSMFMIGIVVFIFDGRIKKIDLKENFLQTKKYFWKILGQLIVVTFFLFLWALLFILPAFVMMIFYAFSLFFVVLEDKPVMESIRESKKLVKGFWWAVFGRMMLLYVPYIFVLILAWYLKTNFVFVFSDVISMIIQQIAISFFGIFYGAVWYLIYKDLRRVKGTDSV